MECKHKETDRTGLYIMVFLACINSYGCNRDGIESDAEEAIERLERIEQAILKTEEGE